MKNGRCRLHGGLSTGPRTQEGKDRIRQTQFKHGRFSREAKANRKLLRRLIKESSSLLREVRDE
jgi:hypothetical protein